MTQFSLDEPIDVVEKKASATSGLDLLFIVAAFVLLACSPAIVIAVWQALL